MIKCSIENVNLKCTLRCSIQPLPFIVKPVGIVVLFFFHGSLVHSELLDIESKNRES